MDNPDLVSLIKESLQGERDAFRKLVEFHQPFAYSVAYRLLVDSYLSEEVVQEAFIKVWHHLEKFDCSMQFRTWLYKIVVNLCYDKMRMLKVRKNHISLDNVSVMNLFSADHVDMDSRLYHENISKIILFLIQSLSPKQQIVFTLSELEELKVEEIVMITGLTPAKIKSNLYCAKQEIRQKLEKIMDRRSCYHE